jgi:hypothetical protein
LRKSAASPDTIAPGIERDGLSIKCVQIASP